MIQKVFIGTSGYNYPHWKDKFYPPKTAQKEWLQFYARHFNSVELNVTFYHLPREEVFQNWYNRTPEHFRFIIKGSRFITHIKRLNDCKEPLNLFFRNAKGLKEKLAGVLWQLPPLFKYNAERIKNFVTLLKRWPQYLYSFEFRNESWFNDEVYNLFKHHNISLCIADSPSFAFTEEITGDFLYLRFHGGRILYASEYSPAELKSWQCKVNAWIKCLREKPNRQSEPTLFAFFNNDTQGFALKNAIRFREFINDGLDWPEQQWNNTN